MKNKRIKPNSVPAADSNASSTAKDPFADIAMRIARLVVKQHRYLLVKEGKKKRGDALS